MGDEESGLLQSLKDSLSFRNNLEKEKAATRNVISTVRQQTDIFRGAVDLEKWLELDSGERNQFRAENYYYKTAREMQEAEDALFQGLAPKAHAEISALLEPIDRRWEEVITIARNISTLTRSQDIRPIPIVDCRPKSNFGIWAKMQEKDLDIDEIFDKLGIRVVVLQPAQAYQLRDKLQEQYPPMQPHKFKHRSETHQPIRDTLSSPKPSFYAAINMNLISRVRLFEVQITTRESFLDMHSKPELPMQSILGYKGK